MGFALWVDCDLAWAAGTSEYRAMGAAVVSRTDLFRAADFRASQRVPTALSVAGHFASFGQINAWLIEQRKPQSLVNPRLRKAHAASRKKTKP